MLWIQLSPFKQAALIILTSNFHQGRLSVDDISKLSIFPTFLTCSVLVVLLKFWNFNPFSFLFKAKRSFSANFASMPFPGLTTWRNTWSVTRTPPETATAPPHFRPPMQTSEFRINDFRYRRPWPSCQTPATTSRPPWLLNSRLLLIRSNSKFVLSVEPSFKTASGIGIACFTNTKTTVSQNQ